MKSKIEIIKTKIWDISEQSKRPEEYCDVAHVIDYCADYILKNKDILDEHAILPDFDCPKCGHNVKVHTLYSYVKRYIEISDHISLAELFPLMGLLELIYNGLSFDAVTSGSMCLSCYERYPIHSVSKIILSANIKNLTRNIMGGITNAH